MIETVVFHGPYVSYHSSETIVAGEDESGKTPMQDPPTWMTNGARDTRQLAKEGTIPTNKAFCKLKDILRSSCGALLSEEMTLPPTGEILL